MLYLKIKNLLFQYSQREILQYPDFIFYQGVSIIRGKSGIGKSTLFSLLIRDLLPISGNIFFCHKDIFFFDKEFYYKEIITIVFQGGLVSSYFSLSDYILLIKRSLPYSLSYESINKYIDLLDLNYILNENVALCSGGERYKIALLINIIKNTKIILLDEPTAHLDSKNAFVIKNIIEDLSKDRIFIIISHDELFFNCNNYFYYDLT